MKENSSHSDSPKPESTTCAETEEEVRIDKAGEQLRVQIARSRLLWSLYTSGSWEFVHLWSSDVHSHDVFGSEQSVRWLFF